MPQFAYKARRRTGEVVQGVLDVPDRAAALMRLAQQQWQLEGGIDPADALPLYLRDKVALTVAERMALRQEEVQR